MHEDAGKSKHRQVLTAESSGARGRREVREMSDIYEEIRKFAEREKEEAKEAIQTEENQVCIKADSYIAKEIKYQTALLHQILNRLNETCCAEKKGNKRCSPFLKLRKIFKSKCR